MTLIRKFEPKDAEAVSSIIRHTMKVSNSGDYPLERLQPLMDYFSPEKVLLLSRERDCLVAEVDNRVVGTVAIEGDELLTFFVHPDFQGIGMGTQLLEQIESIAVANDSQVARTRAKPCRCDCATPGASELARVQSGRTASTRDGSSQSSTQTQPT